MTGSLSQTRGRPEPGRELDALIAEKVMGFTWDESRCRICGWHLASDVASGCVRDNCSLRPAPAKRADSPEPYSTDIAAAFMVVEHVAQEDDGRAIELLVRYSPYSRRWFAQFHAITRKMFAQVSADTAAHAICLAALAALSPADDGGAR